MEIEIKDADKAIQQCEAIDSILNGELAQYLDTSNGVNQIDSVWETNGTDKQEYTGKFSNNNQALQETVNNIKQVTAALKQYAQNAKKTGSKKGGK